MGEETPVIVEPEPVVEPEEESKDDQMVVTNRKESKGSSASKPGRKSTQSSKNAARAPSTPVPKITSSTWSSIVAGGHPSKQTKAPVAPAISVSEEGTPEEPAATPPVPVAPEKEATPSSNKNNTRPPKRDPDCTLVIKNIAENTKEADVLGLFEPFATQTKAKVVG